MLHADITPGLISLNQRQMSNMSLLNELMYTSSLDKDITLRNSHGVDILPLWYEQRDWQGRAVTEAAEVAWPRGEGVAARTPL